jgi:tyrosinase
LRKSKFATETPRNKGRIPHAIFIRKSIRDLEKEYNNGANKKPLEDLIRAFKGIQELPPDDFNSFFVIGGYHGEPFRGAGWENPSWWGGYCNHGNVFFPTWHRTYLARLENALRSIPGCEEVALPYWDETDDETRAHGLLGIFLTKVFQLDGKTIANPLYSYKFNAAVFDNLSPFPDADYSKPKGYQTLRYPYSGLMGPADIKATEVHNAHIDSLPEATINKYLNENVQNWLGFSIENHDGQVIYTGTRKKFAKCLEAPNYMVFSNTSSATQ